MSIAFNDFYKNKRVLITGHTGFKGSWLSLWLSKLGAEVCGYSLEALPSSPAMFELANIKSVVKDYRGDIRDKDTFKKVAEDFQPEIIFHLGAQPIVLLSYAEPRETIETNLMGTVNMLDIARNLPSLKAIVAITTDKVYKDQKWHWGYRENDTLGGSDPYSASKSMAELAIDSFRESFFQKETNIKLASVRAGNVVGGGDFSANRLVPDCVRSLSKSNPIVIRNPVHVRPWQLVLEPLSGYLSLGQKLTTENDLDTAWNFGPDHNDVWNVDDIVKEIIRLWGNGEIKYENVTANKKETKLLLLDCTKTKQILGWKPLYGVKECLSETIGWYKEAFSDKSSDEMMKFSHNQIDTYVSKALSENANWISG